APAPSAVFVLMGTDPVGGALIARVGHVFARVREAAQAEPRPIDVVASPAAIPGPVLLLPALQESDRSLHRRMLTLEAEPLECLERASCDVFATGINHRVMVRKRNEGPDFVVAVLVESGPAAVSVLHRKEPLRPALDRVLTAPFLRLVRVSHFGKRREHFARVVAIRIRLIRVFEIPAA